MQRPSFFSTHSDARLRRVTCETLNSVDWYSRRAYNGAESYRYYSSDEEVDQWQGAPPTEEEREEEEEGQATYDSDSESGQGQGQGQGQRFLQGQGQNFLQCQGQCNGQGQCHGQGYANYHSFCSSSYCHTYCQWRGQGQGQGQGQYRGQGYWHVGHLVRAKTRGDDKREMSTRPWLHDDNGNDSVMALPWHHHISKRMPVMSSRGRRLEMSCARKDMPARPITLLTHFAPIITQISGHSSSSGATLVMPPFVARATNAMTSPRRHRYDATISRDRVKHGRFMPASNYDEPCSPQVTCFGKVKIKERYRKKLGKIACVTRGQFFALP